MCSVNKICQGNASGEMVRRKFFYIKYIKDIISGMTMEDNKHKLILDGNAFYEIDLTCLNKKKKKEKENPNKKPSKKRQRN